MTSGSRPDHGGARPALAAASVLPACSTICRVPSRLCRLRSRWRRRSEDDSGEVAAGVYRRRDRELFRKRSSTLSGGKTKEPRRLQAPQAAALNITSLDDDSDTSSSAQAAPAARAAAPDLPTPVRLREPIKASQSIVIDPSSPVAPVTIADVGEEEEEDKREEDQRRPFSLSDSSSTSTRTSAAQAPPPATLAP